MCTRHTLSVAGSFEVPYPFTHLTILVWQTGQKAVKAIRIGRGYWYIALYPLVTKLELQHLQSNSISGCIPHLQVVIKAVTSERLSFLVVDFATDGIHLDVEGLCSRIHVLEDDAVVVTADCDNLIFVSQCSSLHP